MQTSGQTRRQKGKITFVKKIKFKEWFKFDGNWSTVIFILTCVIVGSFFDHFFSDHTLYPEFIREWNSLWKGLFFAFIISSPYLIYLLYQEVVKTWNERDKY